MLLALVLTPVLLLVHGYHPYAEDGGIYVCSIKHLLDPSLYPYYTGFVTAHEHLSAFPHLVARLVQISTIGLPFVLFVLHLMSIFLTLLAAWALGRRVFPSHSTRIAAVAMFGSVLTLPVAGTSLMLMDPYVTARSFVMPCVLFAAAFALDVCQRPLRRRSLLPFCFASVAALLLHPLMGAYGLIAVLCVLSCALPSHKKRIIAWFALCATALLAAMVVLRFAPLEPGGYVEVAHTRTYWFLSQWRWYEVVGLFAPMAILGGFASRSPHRNTRMLAGGTLLAGALGLLISLLFVHANAHSFAIARLQPLRIFQTVYAVMLLLLGGWLATLSPFRSFARAAAVCAMLCALMFEVQRGIYPQSGAVELPWVAPENDWSNAFLWVREHTPPNTLLALDSHYIGVSGEDTQNAKAMSERSVLPDFSKDGGIASISPSLTAQWRAAQQLSEGVDWASGDNIQSLATMQVRWVILPRSAHTSLDCPYRNLQVKVCTLAP